MTLDQSNKLRDRGWDLKINKGLIVGWVENNSGVRLSFALDIFEANDPADLDEREFTTFLSLTKPPIERFQAQPDELVSSEWYEKGASYAVWFGRRRFIRYFHPPSDGTTFLFELTKSKRIWLSSEKRPFFETLFEMALAVERRMYEKYEDSCTGSDSEDDSNAVCS